MDCNRFIFRESIPDRIVFGGKIRGESAMQSEEDIGTKVEHKYTVKIFTFLPLLK